MSNAHHGYFVRAAKTPGTPWNILLKAGLVEIVPADPAAPGFGEGINFQPDKVRQMFAQPEGEQFNRQQILGAYILN